MTVSFVDFTSRSPNGRRELVTVTKTGQAYSPCGCCISLLPTELGRSWGIKNPQGCRVRCPLCDGGYEAPSDRIAVQLISVNAGGGGGLPGEAILPAAATYEHLVIFQVDSDKLPAMVTKPALLFPSTYGISYDIKKMS